MRMVLIRNRMKLSLRTVKNLSQNWVSVTLVAGKTFVCDLFKHVSIRVCRPMWWLGDINAGKT